MGRAVTTIPRFRRTDLRTRLRGRPYWGSGVVPGLLPGSTWFLGIGWDSYFNRSDRHSASTSESPSIKSVCTEPGCRSDILRVALLTLLIGAEPSSRLDYCESGRSPARIHVLRMYRLAPSPSPWDRGRGTRDPREGMKVLAQECLDVCHHSVWYPSPFRGGVRSWLEAGGRRHYNQGRARIERLPLRLMGWRWALSTWNDPELIARRDGLLATLKGYEGRWRSLFRAASMARSLPRPPRLRWETWQWP